jgi:type II secretory pathway pseudopilin PulG
MCRAMAFRTSGLSRQNSACAPRAAFTLLEVVVAVGVFALGMVVVIGLFAPLTKSAAENSERDAANHIAPLLNAELTRRALNDRSFAAIVALMKTADGKGGHALTDADHNPNASGSDPRQDEQLLFANRAGTKIAGYSDPLWNNVDAEKFFEIALIRNETLAPVDPQHDIVLVYTARIRWPAFVPDSSPTNPRRALPAGFNATAPLRFDHSQKQVLFAAGAIMR